MSIVKEQIENKNNVSFKKYISTDITNIHKNAARKQVFGM
jgi:hypothetical protein